MQHAARSLSRQPPQFDSRGRLITKGGAASDRAEDCEQESESTEVPVLAVCEWVEGVLQPFASRCCCR